MTTHLLLSFVVVVLLLYYDAVSCLFISLIRFTVLKRVQMTGSVYNLHNLCMRQARSARVCPDSVSKITATLFEGYFNLRQILRA